MTSSETLQATARTREAEKIYTAIFDNALPEILRERFEPACRALEGRFAADEVRRCSTAIERVSDLEAFEIACRYAGKLTLLSEKFRLMVYIAETLPENQSYFVADQSSGVRAVAGLVAGGVRSLAKLVKGSILLSRFGDA